MNEPLTDKPTGTITFLFTDIQGSTAMWERDAKRMQAALARHDEILKSIVTDHGGHVFKMIGDACCAAFPSASDALAAALAAQRTIFNEPWDERSRVRVRMALHTGEIEERDGDYFGPPVNRVARLLSAGHGGQTLVSNASHELAADELPPGAELRDIGEHRLKDLTRPERVFQLVAPDLPAEFPALKTLDPRRNNLPAQPNPLVGREREISEVRARIGEPGVRLLTLTGPGGTGKTRLALQAAADVLDEYQDGVFFVALADVDDPALVTSTVARALGLVESAELPIEDLLKQYLSGRALLVILDNFEQVLEAAPLVGSLLAACPGLNVLATSRAALRVYGEQEYPVPPLTLPDPGSLPPTEMLERYEAVRLFAERARAVKPGFSLDGENAPAVAEICARLDGLPLAIELAAARTRLLPPKAMLERLGDRLKLLTGGARDLPSRQQTLRGAVEWSYDLLGEEDRRLFRRASVFSGGRTLDALDEVCNDEGDLDVFGGVESLLEKSLLRQEEGPEGEPRFAMLETIHEYAREKLEQSGEGEEIRRLHAEYFLALAEEAEPKLKGPEQLEWLQRLEAEHDNLRAALSWSVERAEVEFSLRLAGALTYFWFFRDHISEGVRWFDEVLARTATTTRTKARTKALAGTSLLMQYSGEHDRAGLLAEEGLALSRELKDTDSISSCLRILGYLAYIRGEHPRAVAYAEENLVLCRRGGDEWTIALALATLATALGGFADEHERVDALEQESLTAFRNAGDRHYILHLLNNMGDTATLRGEYGRATDLLDEALRRGRELGNALGITISLVNLGLATLFGGDHERAESLLREALQANEKVGDSLNTFCCLEGLAAAAAARGQAFQSARMWGAAQVLREVAGIPLRPEERALLEPRLVDPRTRLGEAAWTVALEEGRAMSQEQAIAIALEGDPAS